jgi:hypothetical protein
MLQEYLNDTLESTKQISFLCSPIGSQIAEKRYDRSKIDDLRLQIEEE